MRRLVVNFARVGDMVLIEPLLRHLARDAELELLSRPWARAVLGTQPYLQAIHGLAHPYRGHGVFDRVLYGGELRALAARLRGRFDEIVVFRQESPKVLGWVRGFAGAATVRTLDSGLTAPDGSRHPADTYRESLARGGFPVDGYVAQPHLVIGEGQRASGAARIDALGRRVIALQAGSSLTHRWYRRRPNLKGLTPRQWAGLVERLLAGDEADAVVLLGSRPERREARAIIAAIAPAHRARVHDWTGAASLADLPGIFSATRALLSVDTGPAHIAAAVGCPALVVFGPSDPKRWQPRGPGAVVPLVGAAPCQFCLETPEFRRCRANVCLSTLSDAAIWAGWERLRERVAALAAKAHAAD